MKKKKSMKFVLWCKLKLLLLQTFHTPSFGDEDFDIPAIHPHQHQQQHQQQQHHQQQHDPMHGYQSQVFI